VESAPPSQPEAAAAEPPPLDEVVARHGDTLKGIRGVERVDSAECNGAPCIRITVFRRTQKLLSELPVSLEGYPVTVAERKGGH
jgi:hypothetical protein